MLDYIITIKPHWLSKILCGEKTMELQKRNLKPGHVGLAASGTSKLFGTAHVVDVQKLDLKELKRNKSKHQVDDAFLDDYLKKRDGSRHTSLWAHNLEDVKKFKHPVDYKRKPGQVVKVNAIDEETQAAVKAEERRSTGARRCNFKSIENEINEYTKRRSSSSAAAFSSGDKRPGKSAAHSKLISTGSYDTWVAFCKSADRKACMTTNKDLCKYSKKACVPRPCEGRKRDNCNNAYCIYADNKCHVKREHRPAQPRDDDGDLPHEEVCSAYYGRPSCKNDEKCHWDHRLSRCRPKQCKERITPSSCSEASAACSWKKKSNRGRKFYCLDRPAVSRQTLRDRSCGYHALENLMRNLSEKPVFSEQQMKQICRPGSADCTIPLMMYSLSGRNQPYGLPSCVKELWADEETALEAIKTIGSTYKNFDVTELSHHFIRDKLHDSLRSDRTLGLIILIDIDIRAAHYVAFTHLEDGAYLRIDSLPGVKRRILSVAQLQNLIEEEYTKSPQVYSFGIIVQKK